MEWDLERSVVIFALRSTKDSGNEKLAAGAATYMRGGLVTGEGFLSLSKE